jgi:hypothetical protein
VSTELKEKSIDPSKLANVHIINELPPRHMAINLSLSSPLLCGTPFDEDDKIPAVKIYRLYRDPLSKQNLMVAPQTQMGWEYGVPMVLTHPEQKMCGPCKEYANAMQIVVIDLDEGERLLGMDVSAARQTFEEWLRSD